MAAASVEQGAGTVKVAALAAFWLGAVVLGTRLLLQVSRAARQPSDGFAAYYTSARLLSQGERADRFYEDSWFRSQTEHLAPGASDIYNVNPPTAAVLALPLIAFDHDMARLVWTGLNLALVAVSLTAVAWQLGLHGLRLPAFVCIATAFQPLHANFQHGQAYVLLLGLLLLVWIGFRQRRPAMLGVGLGLMLVLKTAAIPLWLLFLVRRQWKALGWGLLTTVVVVMISLPRLGIEAWSTYVRLLPGLAAAPSLAVTAYQSQLGFFHHLLIFDPQWNPHPWLNVPWLGFWLPALAMLAMLVASARAARRADAPDLVLALFVMASILLSPVALDYHYVLALLPVAILLAHLPSWGSLDSLIAGLGWLTAVAAIGLNLPYQSAAIQGGAWALLAYPKLYGAILLWILAMTGSSPGRIGDAR
jgi:hypothetical protein